MQIKVNNTAEQHCTAAVVSENVIKDYTADVSVN